MVVFVHTFVSRLSYSGVASVDNWKDEYSYINFVFTDLKKKINYAEHNIWILVPPIIDAGQAIAELWHRVHTYNSIQWRT